MTLEQWSFYAHMIESEITSFEAKAKMVIFVRPRKTQKIYTI